MNKNKKELDKRNNQRWLLTYYTYDGDYRTHVIGQCNEEEAWYTATRKKWVDQCKNRGIKLENVNSVTWFLDECNKAVTNTNNISKQWNGRLLRSLCDARGVNAYTLTLYFLWQCDCVVDVSLIVYKVIDVFPHVTKEKVITWLNQELQPHHQLL